MIVLFHPNKYDQGGAAAFALGRLTSITDPSGSETYSYDQGGRVTQKQKVIGATPYTIQYQHNAGGQLTQVTYPSGRVVAETPDNIGRLNSLNSGSSPTYVNAVPTYNSAGKIISINYGNGVVANLAYSAARQQLTSVSYTSGVYPFPTVFNLNYGYMNGQANCGTSTTTGNDGLIQCIQDNSGTAEAGRSVIYSYDMLGRLNTATTTGSSGYGQWGLSWVYDRYGNRLSQNQTAGSPPMNSLTFATTPAPPSNPPGGAYTNRPDGYSFDPSGNMLNDGQNTLTYDAENCLTSSTNSSTGTSTYNCDAQGIRVKKALQGSTITVYVFSGGNDIAEYDNGAAVNSPSREYIYLGGRLLATVQGATLTYHHSDHLSVRLSTDGTSGSSTYGQVISQQGHYPYGEQWYASNSTTKFFFTSYERDSESGNDYAMARFYINRFGRFSCVDPSLGGPGDPQSWNRYAYARNNPVNITDPSGQNWLFQLFGALLAVFGILTGQPWLIKLGMTIAGAGLMPIPGPGGVGTPSTFPDPLGNTQATLNSIYHPIDPSKFGSPPFLDPGTDYFDPNTGGGDSSVNQKVLAECVDQYFGVRLDRFDKTQKGKNGLFVGYGPDTLSNGGNNKSIYVQNYVGFSSAQLVVLNNSLPNHKLISKNSHLDGLEIPTNPYNDYTAYDAISPMVETQVHELGNSLSVITGAAFNPETVHWNPLSDYDAGQLLEDCVRNKGGFK
jgi:RHS repeat-associated protein